MPMHTTADMDRLTQGAIGTSSSKNKDGSTHHTAYTNTNRVSYDEDKDGNVSNLHTTHNGSRQHYDIEVVPKK